MSAFGNITCGYCGEEYYELDKHGCCITALHDTIERLQARLAAQENAWCKKWSGCCLNEPPEGSP